MVVDPAPPLPAIGTADVAGERNLCATDRVGATGWIAGCAGVSRRSRCRGQTGLGSTAPTSRSYGATPGIPVCCHA